MSDVDIEEENDFAPGAGSDDDDGFGGGDESDIQEPEPEPPVAENNALYLLYNRQFYKVPKKDGDKSGWQRCYNRTVKVQTGKVLGQMIAGHEGWPKHEDLTKLVSADKIVVLRGKLKKEDAAASHVWYLLLEVEGVSNKHDHQILRHIPKQVYKDLVESIKKDPQMQESSLLRMQAIENNMKPLNPDLNGFVKLLKTEELKSAAQMPERKPVDPNAKKKKDEDKKRKHDELEAEEQQIANPSDNAEKKAPPKSMLSLWKKPAADDAEGPSNEGAKPAAKPAEQPAPKRKADSDNEKVTYKKTRIGCKESWEVLVTDPESRVEFTPPPGATSAAVSIEWSFD